MNHTIQKQKGKHKDYITVLRFIACLLIINSHCRQIYPISFLAVGGGHGNGIFFVVSGFCLAFIRKPFLSWYKQRTQRLLPATLACLVIGMFIDSNAAAAWVQGTVLLYCLNRYWFVWAIMIYYLVFFYIIRRGYDVAKRALLLHTCQYFVAYILFVDKTVFSVELEGFSPVKVFFYFGIFLLGGVVRLYWENRTNRHDIKAEGIWCIVAIGASCVVWATEYFMVTKLQTAYTLQFLIHASIFIFSGAVLYLGELVSEYIYLPDKPWAAAVNRVAQSTLEIYLVQIIINPIFEAMDFPLNWVLFFGLSIVLGIGLQYGISLCEEQINRMKNNGDM